VSLYEPPTPPDFNQWETRLRATVDDRQTLESLAAIYTEYNRMRNIKGKWSINDVLLLLIRKCGGDELNALTGTPMPNSAIAVQAVREGIAEYETAKKKTTQKKKK
jgi:hypothetical protein